jgi:hypothetical protein
VTDRHDWMRAALDRLFDDVDPETAAEAVRDDHRRSELRGQLALTLATPVPDSQYADNLFQGLLALRMKFDRETARAKLELNLAMRDGRGSS